jgi:urease accessory protein
MAIELEVRAHHVRLFHAGLLAALWLGSAALPIGAFAYSQGLEQAVEQGNVHDIESARRWIVGLLEASVLSADVPMLLRLQRAWSQGDELEVRRLSDRLFAMRPSRELREEERQLGGALFRLLGRAGLSQGEAWAREPHATLASAFALAAANWQLPAEAAAASYCFAWAEAQVGAATRLIPLGQTAAQAVLSSALAAIEAALPGALALEDDEIAATALGQALLSASHETQYSRLFRS